MFALKSAILWMGLAMLDLLVFIFPYVTLDVYSLHGIFTVVAFFLPKKFVIYKISILLSILLVSKKANKGYKEYLGQSRSVFWDECIPLQFSRMVVTWARKVLKTFEKQLWIDGAVSQLYQLVVMCLYVLLLRHNFLFSEKH